MATRYAKTLKEQALTRLNSPDRPSLQALSDELNVPLRTLKRWNAAYTATPSSYTAAFREEAVKRLLPPEAVPIRQLAAELKLHPQTLKRWLDRAQKARRHTQAFREAAVKRLLPPESYPIEVLALELDVKVSTLARWRADLESHWTGVASSLASTIDFGALDETSESPGELEPLAPAEWDVMLYLWRYRQSNVQLIHRARLPRNPQTTYSGTLTILTRLVGKGWAKQIPSSNHLNLYAPNVPPQPYVNMFINNLLTHQLQDSTDLLLQTKALLQERLQGRGPDTAGLHQEFPRGNR